MPLKPIRVLITGALLSTLVVPAFSAPIDIALNFVISDEYSEAFDVFAEYRVGEESRRVHLSQCTAVDVDSFTENLIGTSVICDGRQLSFDVYEGGFAVIAEGDLIVTVPLETGAYFLNGVPLLIE